MPIPDTIARLRQELGVPLDRTVRGPVPLNRFYEELNLLHVALPVLTCGTVTRSEDTRLNSSHHRLSRMPSSA